MKRLLTLAALLTLLGPAPSLAATDRDALRQAMQDELERSMSALSLEDMAPPYFIAYRISDVQERVLEGTEGALVSNASNRWRMFQVEVRVGDYRFDNTNYMGAGRQSRGAYLSLDDDYDEIRRQLWLATDMAYKQALEALAGKESALQNRVRENELPDLSQETPTQWQGPDDHALPRLDGDEALVRDLSQALAGIVTPRLTSALIHSQLVETHYANSEGTAFSRQAPAIGVALVAGTQAEDGRTIEDQFVSFARDPDRLPSRQQLLTEAQDLVDRLTRLRSAPLLERYNGPVLFEGQAAAELMAQQFAPSLIAHRMPIMEGYGGGRGQWGPVGGFQEKIGSRVMPRFLALHDDPTLETLHDQQLVSGMAIDDQGVMTARSTLVERGRLRALLSGRTPSIDTPNSTGNVRGLEVLPTTLVVSSSERLKPRELDKELQALVEESGNDYGVVVTRLFNRTLASGIDRFTGLISGGWELDSASAVEAYRVYADGRRELLRNVDLVGISPQAFRDIIAVSQDNSFYAAPFSGLSPTGMGMQWGMNGSSQRRFIRPVVSWSVPSLLFEELTLRKPSGDTAGQPVLAPPPRTATQSVERDRPPTP